jgi:hypothetical protein
MSIYKEPPRQFVSSLLEDNTERKAKAFYHTINRDPKVKDSPYEAYCFESLRSRERQKWLFGKGRTTAEAGIYAQPNAKKVTWTLYSKHMDGLAFDTMWRDKKTKRFTYVPQDFWDLVPKIGKRFGLNSLAPYEFAHLESDGTPYSKVQYWFDIGLSWLAYR